MTKKDALKRFLSLSDDEQVSLWNEWCDDSHNWDKELSVNNAVFFETNYFRNGMGLMDVLSDVEDGNYTYSDRFVTLTEDDMLVSCRDMMTVIDDLGIQGEFSEWLENSGV